MIFISKLSWTQLIGVLYLLISGFFLLQYTMTLFICFGYDNTYYNVFRFHKKNYGEMVIRKSLAYTMATTNLVGPKEFIKRLIWGTS